MKLKKLLALAMTSILLMSTMMMTASADEITIGGGTGTGVDKSVEVEEGVMTFTTTLNMSSTAVTAPTTDFEYTLTAGESVSNDVYPVTAGVLSGMTISYTASYTTTDIVTADGSIGEPITINFTAAKFTDPGIYVYELTATANTDAGIIMDANNTRYIYVYVENDETADGTGLVVSEIIMYTEAVYTATTYELPSDSTVKSAGFTNSYGVVASTDGAPGAAGGEATNNFIITATAGGTGADHNKEFTYTLTSTSGIDDGTIFYVEDGDGNEIYIKFVKDSDGNGGTFVVVESDGSSSTDDSAEFTLSSTETYTIHSVVKDMSFTATITDEDGYTMSAKKDTDANYTEIETEYLFTNTVGEPTNATVVVGIDFLTYYDLVIPSTGVILQYLPFVILGLLALGFVSFKAYTFSAKK